jgi:tetratricopeptide (TPR) repeat protein
MVLAALHYKRGDFDAATKVLETAISYNKKQMLLYNVYAYLLVKEGDKAKAIELLLRALKVEKDNESSKDNLLRLQNGKRLNMKRFGMPWYALQLEKPPASMGQQQGMARRGFRQPKRRR